MAAKNLRIIGTTVGAFKAGDVVPAYALAAANPANIVEHRLAEWTDDAATVDIPAESLARSAPDASADLVKAHAKATAEVRELRESNGQLHDKCVAAEAKAESLAKELADKVAELATAKADRDAARVDLETAKSAAARLKEENDTLNVLLSEAEKASPKAPTK